MLGDFNFHVDSLDCALATDSFDWAGLLWSYPACIDLHTHASTCARTIPWDSFPPLVTESLAKLCVCAQSLLFWCGGAGALFSSPSFFKIVFIYLICALWAARETSAGRLNFHQVWQSAACGKLTCPIRLSNLFSLQKSPYKLCSWTDFTSHTHSYCC